MYLDNLWRCGFLHALFLSFWTKICLIRLWLCYIIGFCSFNVWSVSIDKDCLEVANTHFDYSAWLFSSRRKPYIHLFFFQMKVFWKLRPIFDTRHAYESQISRVAPSWFFCCFFFSSFIFLFFFSRKNWLLPKTPLLLFFRFSSFFQNWFHTMSSVFIVATSQKTDDPYELNVGSLTMETKIMKNGFSLFWALKQNCFFFPITKRIEKARCSSKSFTESLTRSSSIWYQAMTKILVNT